MISSSDILCIVEVWDQCSWPQSLGCVCVCVAAQSSLQHFCLVAAMGDRVTTLITVAWQICWQCIPTQNKHPNTIAHTNNFPLYSRPQNSKQQNQHIYNSEMAITIDERQHYIYRRQTTKTIKSMINAHNHPSLPNIAIYKLFLPYPSK